jgi:hypothetical protein
MKMNTYSLYIQRTDDGSGKDSRKDYHIDLLESVEDSTASLALFGLAFEDKWCNDDIIWGIYKNGQYLDGDTLEDMDLNFRTDDYDFDFVSVSESELENPF